MTCNETLEQLIAFDEGELDNSARPPLEQHLAGCASCREELSLLRGSWDLLPAWEGLEPSSDLTARIMAAVQAPVVVSLDEKREARNKPPTYAERILSRPWVARLATAASIAI